jgi:hypothetical protein
VSKGARPGAPEHKPKIETTVESHVSKSETWGTPCVAAAVENQNHTGATRPKLFKRCSPRDQEIDRQGNYGHSKECDKS